MKKRDPRACTWLRLILRGFPYLFLASVKAPNYIMTLGLTASSASDVCVGEARFPLFAK